MKWLILVAFLAAIVLALPIVLRDIRRSRTSGEPLAARLAASLLPGAGSLVVIALAAYAGRELGFFSVPLIVLAFVPLGLVVRWTLIGTRESRARRQPERPAPTVRQRVGRVAFWPLFLVMVLGVAVLAAFAGMMAAPR